MQGQRGTIGSLSETFFDHSSTSSNAAIEQQVCWNNIPNPIENRSSNCLLPSNDMNIGYVNSIGREEQLGRWSLGEPSSSSTQDVSYNDWKTDSGWPLSMTTSANAGPRLEGWKYEQNSLCAQSSNSDTVAQNIGLNAGLVGNVDSNCQVTQWSNICKPSVSENERKSLGVGPEAFILSSGNADYDVDDNDSRPGCSYEGRRASCKRKALEGNAGQSSSSAENGVWNVVSASYSAGSHVNMSPSSRQAHPSLGLDGEGSASDSIPEPLVLPPTAESSHRNFRLRINPSRRQEPIAHPMFSTGDIARQFVVSSAPSSSRPLSTDHSMGLRSAPIVHDASSENPSVVIHGPPMQRNRGSGSRTGSSSNSNLSAHRVVPRTRHQSRSMARNQLDHPMFVPTPELSTFVRNPGLSSESISAPANVASTSRTGSNSGAIANSASMWVPLPNPTSQYPRRLSELVRQSLMSSLCTESGGQNNHSLLPSGTTTSQEEMLLSSRVANQGHHHPHPRSLPWLERHDAGLLRVPHAFRTLATATEGRSMLAVSEIRNVLDLMRRGENLRFEDVMILNQSVLLGVADTHDRHRDMRLDVDNMSYEELLALEERIGNVSTGLSEETIIHRLKRQKHSSALGAQLEAEPCCICQEEYNDGDDLGTLECGHDFHADCIKQWLLQKNLCPICKTTGLTK